MVAEKVVAEKAAVRAAERAQDSTVFHFVLWRYNIDILYRMHHTDGRFCKNRLY